MRLQNNKHSKKNLNDENEILSMVFLSGRVSALYRIYFASSKRPIKSKEFQKHSSQYLGFAPTVKNVCIAHIFQTLEVLEIPSLATKRPFICVRRVISKMSDRQSTTLPKILVNDVQFALHSERKLDEDKHLMVLALTMSI